MKAISLWQPWASAIAQGIKTIETRGWPTKYRGPLAIHAARKWTADQKDFATHEFMCGRLRGGRMPLGAIVAVCELVDCKPSGELETTVSAVERLWGNFDPGRFGWILANVRPLPAPVPYIGRQGFFNVPDELNANNNSGANAARR